MERRAAVLEAAHLPEDEPPVALDELAHEVGAAERHGREDGGLGAAGEQELGHLPLHLLEAGRPADHVHLVVVAFAVDVGAGLEQALRDGEVPLRDGPVQGGGAIELVAQVHVEAEPEQQLDAVEVTAIRRKVQQRHAPLAAGDADLRRMLGEQAGELRRVPLTAAATIWPSRLRPSTCALSARQLLKPYSLAMSSCA